jgi:hypothetical protein
VEDTAAARGVRYSCPREPLHMAAAASERVSPVYVGGGIGCTSIKLHVSVGCFAGSTSGSCLRYLRAQGRQVNPV